MKVTRSESRSASSESSNEPVSNSGRYELGEATENAALAEHSVDYSKMVNRMASDGRLEPGEWNILKSLYRDLPATERAALVAAIMQSPLHMDIRTSYLNALSAIPLRNRSRFESSEFEEA
jgi:hypothetical protein